MSLIIAKITEDKIEAISDGYQFEGEKIVDDSREKLININDEVIVGGVGVSCLIDIFKDYCCDNSSQLSNDKINRYFLLKFINTFLNKISKEYDKMKLDETDLILITKKGIFSYTIDKDMNFIPIQYDGCKQLSIGVGSDFAKALLDIDVNIEIIMNKCVKKYPSLGGKITKIELKK